MDASDLVRLLAATIAQAAAATPRPVLGIDGPDAAGKTTLADAVAAASSLPVVRASVDGFHHPRAIRHGGPYEASFDVDTLVRRLLRPFTTGADTVVVQAFDHLQDAPRERVQEVPARAVLVLDGVFLHRPQIRPFLAVGVYLDVPHDEVLRRARLRDAEEHGSVAEVDRRYRERYLPAQARYRAQVQPDLVVDNTDPARPVLLAELPVQR